MLLLCDEAGKRAVQSLYTDADVRVSEQVLGDVIPVEIGLVKSIKNSADRLWNPQDITGTTFRIGMGNPFQKPIAGVFTVGFDSSNSGEIAYNCTPGDFENVLNNLGDVIDAGGVDVSGEINYYIVTFREPQAQPLITVDISQLAPLSKAKVAKLITGTLSVGEVQLVQIVQDSAALDDIETASAAASVEVDILTVGGGGLNQKVRFTLEPAPFDGRWTLSIGGEETDLIKWDSTEEELLPLVEALSTVGEGNVTVAKEDETNFLLSFKGDKADTDMGACTASGTSLRALQTVSGFLDLRSPALSLLFGDEDSIQVTLEIKATPAGGLPSTIFRQEVTLLAPVIENDSPETVDDSTVRHGAFTMAGGEDTYLVEFAPPLAFTPTIIHATLAVVDGGATYDVTVVQSSISEEGCLLTFGAPANAGDKIFVTAYT